MAVGVEQLCSGERRVINCTRHLHHRRPRPEHFAVQQARSVPVVFRQSVVVSHSRLHRMHAARENSDLFLDLYYSRKCGVVDD